jgi:hypothetical protein
MILHSSEKVPGTTKDISHTAANEVRRLQLKPEEDETNALKQRRDRRKGSQSYTIMLLTDPSGTVQKEAHPFRKGGEASTVTGELNATAHFGPLVSLRAPKAKRRHVLLLRQRLLPHRPHRVILPGARGFCCALHKLVLRKDTQSFVPSSK